MKIAGEVFWRLDTFYRLSHPLTYIFRKISHEDKDGFIDD